MKPRTPLPSGPRANAILRRYLLAAVTALVLCPSHSRADLACSAALSVSTGVDGVCYADVHYSVTFPCVTAGGGFGITLLEGTGQPDPSCTDPSCQPGGNLSGSSHTGVSRWVFQEHQLVTFRFTARGGGPYCPPEGFACSVDSSRSATCGGLAFNAAQGEIEYHHVDALGSTRLVTDGDSEVIARHDYLPFGEEIPTDTWQRSDALHYGGSNHVRQRFTGQIRDDESGLDYFGARYFSSQQGRFMSPDLPFADQELWDPQSWNLYTYVNNRPLVAVDSTGTHDEYVSRLMLETMKPHMTERHRAMVEMQQRYENAGSLAGGALVLGTAAAYYGGPPAWSALAAGAKFAMRDPVGAARAVGYWLLSPKGQEVLGAIEGAAIPGPTSGLFPGARVMQLAEANLAKTGRAVLGSYPGYLEKAHRTGASFFDIGDVWNSLSREEQWAANRHFLDKVAEAGQQIYLSVPKGKINPTSWLAREVAYLVEEKGYRWLNQWSLAAPVAP